MAPLRLIPALLLLCAAGVARAAGPAELAALPEPELAQKLASLGPPWEARDTGTRTDLINLTHYLLRPGAAAEERAPYERALVAALQAANHPINRLFFMDQLELLACEEAVPVLVALLKDPELSVPAIGALGGIRSAASRKALLGALKDAEPRLAVHLLNALARQPYGVAGDLLPYARSVDPDVRLAALRVLSLNGSSKAASVLQRAALAPPSAEQAEALSLYIDYVARLSPRRAAPHVRALLKTEGGACAALSLVRSPAELQRHLRDPRPAVRRQALQLLMERPAGEWAALVSRMATNAPPGLRVTAVLGLRQLPRGEAEPLLRRALADKDENVRREAAAGLLDVTDKAALGEVLARLKEEPAATRGGLAQVVMERAESVALDLELARGADPQLRRAAWQQLAGAAGAAELPALFDLALAQPEPGAGNAAVRAALRLKAQASAAEHLASAAGTNQAERVLGWLAALGGEKALQLVVARLDSRQRLAAVRTLSNWKEPAAIPELARLATSAGDTAEQVLAIRGAVRLVDESNLSAPEKAEQLRRLQPAAARPEERELVQAALRKLENTTTQDTP